MDEDLKIEFARWWEAAWRSNNYPEQIQILRAEARAYRTESPLLSFTHFREALGLVMAQRVVLDPEEDAELHNEVIESARQLLNADITGSLGAKRFVELMLRELIYPRPRVIGDGLVGDDALFDLYEQIATGLDFETVMGPAVDL